MQLLPILDPVWVPLSEGTEVTAWPLRLTDGSFLLGVSGEEAEAYARALGGELTSAAEEDQITAAAALVLTPITHAPPRWPTPAAQALLVAAQLQERGGCDESAILAGVCKVWTRDTRLDTREILPGRICNYGWPVPAAEVEWHRFGDQPPRRVWMPKRIPAYLTVTVEDSGWRVLQGLADFHGRDHGGDYSQGVRVARRVEK